MRLGDLLDEARRRTFVGRDDELARFGDALSGRSPRRVFLVHGVGGIGKSTLIGEFRASALAAGRPPGGVARRAIGRASCRGRGEILVVPGSFEKKNMSRKNC